MMILTSSFGEVCLGKCFVDLAYWFGRWRIAVTFVHPGQRQAARNPLRIKRLQ